MAEEFVPTSHHPINMQDAAKYNAVIQILMAREAAELLGKTSHHGSEHPSAFQDQVRDAMQTQIEYLEQAIDHLED